jgi:hypothetical protein
LFIRDLILVITYQKPEILSIGDDLW